MNASQTEEFRAYLEEWESDAAKNKLNLNEFKLLQKYKGMRFYDDGDEKIYKAISSNLGWKKKDKPDPETPCYVLLAKPALLEEDEEKYDDEDNDDDNTTVPYHINDYDNKEAIFDLIAISAPGHGAERKGLVFFLCRHLWADLRV